MTLFIRRAEILESKDDLIESNVKARGIGVVIGAEARLGRVDGLGRELGDPMRQTGDLAACGIGMHDAFLRRPHDDRLCFFERRERRAAVAARDRFLDLAHAPAQLRPASLVDLGSPRDLAGGLAGRSGIGHRALLVCGWPRLRVSPCGLDRKKTSGGEHLAASHALIMGSP